MIELCGRLDLDAEAVVGALVELVAGARDALAIHAWLADQARDTQRRQGWTPQVPRNALGGRVARLVAIVSLTSDRDRETQWFSQEPGRHAHIYEDTHI